MKKLLVSSLLASMFAATSASAQDLQIYGKIRSFIEFDQVGTNDGVTKNAAPGSRIGFKGSEDLGNGLKLNFVIETGVANDQPSASTLGDRISIISLSNSFGSLAMGRDKHSIARIQDNYDMMGNHYGSSATTIHKNFSDRFNNAGFVEFKPIQNVKLHYYHSLREVATGKDAFSAGVDTTFGNLSVSYAYYDNSVDSTSNSFGAKYKIDATKTTFSTLYSNEKVAGVSTTGKSVSVLQEVDKLMLMGSYGTNDNVTSYNAGVQYHISKRTSVHLRYRLEDGKLASADRKQIGLGLEHNF